MLSKNKVHFLNILALSDTSLLNVSVWEWFHLALHGMENVSSRVLHSSSVERVTVGFPVFHREFEMLWIFRTRNNVIKIEHEGRIGLLHTLVNQSESLTLDSSVIISLMTLWNNSSFSNWRFLSSRSQL